MRGPALNANEPRVNDRIRKSPVRLISEDGEQLGIVPLEEARARALSVGMDLVEVGANADPPVVKILDWGKAKFDREKKARESRKKNQIIEVKEVKFRPTIGDNDFNIKLAQAQRFLEKGKKVKVTVFFRFRQLRRPELGQTILDKVSESTRDIATIESRSKLEGRSMIMILSPHGHAAAAPAADSAASTAPAAVAPVGVAPSAVAPSAVAPSAVAPSAVAPSAVAPSGAAPAGASRTGAPPST